MRILVAVNDAGGADLLAPLVEGEWEGHEWFLACRDDAPALRTFRRHGLLDAVVRRPHPSSFAGQRFHLGLCNVGWRDNRDDVVPAMREVTDVSVGVLDNWINFRERFGYPDPAWLERLPQVTAVTDDRAFEMARAAGFPGLTRLRNYHVTRLRQAWAARAPELDQRTDFLFISQLIQPRTDDPRASILFHQHEDAERALVGELLARWPDVSGGLGCRRLVIRCHPAAPTGVYQAEAAQGDVPVEVVPPGTHLLESLLTARLALGFTSAALMNAMAVGVPAYAISVAEGGGGPLPLPSHRYVEGLDELLSVAAHDPSPACPLDFFQEPGLSELAATLMTKPK